MITKISIQQVASYGENPVILKTDKKINLVYGLNGTGKTTISNFLQNKDDLDFSNCSIEGLNDEKILVYNKKFIDDNFYQDTQKGIFSLKSENKEAKVKIDNTEKEIKKINNQIKNNEQKNGLQFDLDRNKESIDNLEKTTEEKTWKIKTKFSGGDRILEFCLQGKMGSKNSLFEHISNWGCLYKALCGIVWIIEFEFTSDEVNHVDEIMSIPISPSSSFGQLNFTVNPLHDAVGNLRFQVVDNA